MAAIITQYHHLPLDQKTVDAIGYGRLMNVRKDEIAARDKQKQWIAPMAFGFIVSSIGFLASDDKDPSKYIYATAFIADVFLATSRFLKYKQLNENAKALDKAVVMATQNESQAIFKSTVPELIADGHITKKEELSFTPA